LTDLIVYNVLLSRVHDFEPKQLM